MFVCEGWREETKSSIPYFPEKSEKYLNAVLGLQCFLTYKDGSKNTCISLPGLWVSVHSAVGCCLQFCSSLSPSLAARTGLTFDLSSSSSVTALPQGVTLSMLGSFSKIPCLLWRDDFTPLFLLFLILHACRFLQSHRSAFTCFFHFLPLYSWDNGSCASQSWAWAQAAGPGALVQLLALGRELG